MSLLSRLFLLVAIALLPAVVIQAYNEVDLRHWRQKELRANALQLAKSINTEQLEIVESVRHLLEAIAELPSIKGHDSRACSAYLHSLKDKYPDILRLFAVDTDGQVFCSSGYQTPNLNVADRTYFTRAMASKAFAVGEVVVGRITHEKSIHFALPFVGKDGRIAGVVVSAWNLGWLSNFLARQPRLADQTLVVTDRKGGVLAMAPSHDGLPDDRLPGYALAYLSDRQDRATEVKDAAGHRWIVAYSPISQDPKDLFIGVWVDKTAALRDIDAATRRGVALIVFGTALVLVLAWLGARRFIHRPITRLTEATERWRSGDYTSRVERISEASEFARMSVALNSMAAALEERDNTLRQLNANLEQRVVERTRQLQEEMSRRQTAEAALVQAQKMEAIGQLTGGVAHDFNNLLTVVLGNLELLSMRAAGERDRRLIDGALQAGQRGAKLNQQLLAFSRKQRLAPKPTNVNLLIKETTELLARTLGGRVAVEAQPAESLWPALVDPTQLETAILNLAINARDAMPNGGTLSLAAANVARGTTLPNDLPPGDYVMLSVADTGTGMSEEVLARVFEPFFTTKEVGKGSGLGLSQVYGFVKQSGGTVAIESRLNHGTTVRLYFPRSAMPSAAPAKEAAQPGPTRHGRILLVEDDSQVRQSVASCLRSLGYSVIETENGEKALDILGQDPQIELLLTDHAMPGISGLELVRAARRTHPGLATAVMTGHVAAAAIEREDDAPLVIMKPFTLTELAQGTDTALLAQRRFRQETWKRESV